MTMALADAVKKLGDVDKAVRDEAMAAVLTAKQRAVPHLVEALPIPGAPIGKLALLLAALNAREGLPAFYALLGKGIVDVDGRSVIARALGELLDGRDAFDDDAKKAVMALSRDGHALTRQLTVKALAQVGDNECELRLRELTADRDESVKAAASQARAALLSARGDVDVNVNVDASGTGDVDDVSGPVDLAALVQRQQASGDPAPTGPFAALVTSLRDPRWALRNGAVDVAVARGKDVIPTLVEVLSQQNTGAKIGAAQAIARLAPQFGAPDAVAPLLAIATSAASTDDARALRSIALKALACSLTGSEEGLAQPLLPLTRDADPFVRAGALLCLGRLADRVGARAAALALTDPHEHVKEAAAVALSEGTREEDQELVLPLLAVLGGMPSPGAAVREAILLALARIKVDPASPDGAATLIRLRHRVRPHVLGMTASLRRTAIAILESAYAADDPAPIGVVDDILDRLHDDHPEVRLLAASFLSQHLEPGMSGAVEALEDALDRAEQPLSLLCLEALVKHDTDKAARALAAAAEDPDATVAARAHELASSFVPKTREWVAVGRPPASSPASAPPSAPPSAPRAASEGDATAPKRVRPARGGGDVVEAKDASVSARIVVEAKDGNEDDSDDVTDDATKRGGE